MSSLSALQGGTGWNAAVQALRALVHEAPEAQELRRVQRKVQEGEKIRKKGSARMKEKGKGAREEGYLSQRASG